ncbi:hypothetical protein TNCV_973281 [Trichonephila clavipes]|nr:hypothetical protein TNCV_973281 [Trichonephila clavipes]
MNYGGGSVLAWECKSVSELRNLDESVQIYPLDAQGPGTWKGLDKLDLTVSKSPFLDLTVPRGRTDLLHPGPDMSLNSSVDGSQQSSTTLPETITASKEGYDGYLVVLSQFDPPQLSKT